MRRGISKKLGFMLLILMFSLLLGSIRVSFAAGTTCVMFIFDLSGSMSNDIDQCISTAKQTIDILAPLGVKFGLITHVDYPHYYSYCGYSNTYGSGSDYAYLLRHPCGTPAATVKITIDGLDDEVGGGADLPEPYARIMCELVHDGNIQSLGYWKTGDQRNAVHFGDSKAHWCDMPGGSTGCDPGRDEVCGTADDCDLLEAAIDLGLHRIRYIFINPEKTSDDDAAHAFWEAFSLERSKMIAFSLEEITPEQLAREIQRAVGGFWLPVDKFGLLAPYIGLISTIVAATVATAIYVKRVKPRKEKQ